tara:strand:- start:992 stop:1441 length:450 start_codon:yes stop_codon:yes gene_type:complete
VKNLNFLGEKDITWVENNFEPIPEKYILGKNDIILKRGSMRTAHQNKNRSPGTMIGSEKFTFLTNFNPTYKTALNALGIIRYGYDIYDVKFNKNGAIVGAGRGKFRFEVDEKYPLLHGRYEHTLMHETYYKYKQQTSKFMNWLINPLEE